MRKWFTQIAVVLVIIVSISWWQSRGIPRTVAQSFPLPLLNADTLQTVPNKDHRIELVYFFAPWCGVCKYSAKNAETVVRWFPDTRIVFVGLDFDSREEVEEFARSSGISGPVVLGHRDIQDAWQVEAYPTYVVIDRKGQVASVSVGYSSMLGTALRMILPYYF